MNTQDHRKFGDVLRDVATNRRYIYCESPGGWSLCDAETRSWVHYDNIAQLEYVGTIFGNLSKKLFKDVPLKTQSDIGTFVKSRDNSFKSLVAMTAGDAGLAIMNAKADLHINRTNTKPYITLKQNASRMIAQYETSEALHIALLESYKSAKDWYGPHQIFVFSTVAGVECAKRMFGDNAAVLTAKTRPQAIEMLGKGAEVVLLATVGMFLSLQGRTFGKDCAIHWCNLQRSTLHKVARQYPDVYITLYVSNKAGGFETACIKYNLETIKRARLEQTIGLRKTHA